jgi:TorA maturation chaperone TorD
MPFTWQEKFSDASKTTSNSTILDIQDSMQRQYNKHNDTLSPQLNISSSQNNCQQQQQQHQFFSERQQQQQQQLFTMPSSRTCMPYHSPMPSAQTIPTTSRFHQSQIASSSPSTFYPT